MGRGRPQELFPTDEPMSASSMIGRSNDIEALRVQLSVGANVIIAAPRRTGKTTVCNAAVDKLATDDFYVVTVDLFSISDVDQLAGALVEQTITNRPMLREAVHAAGQAGKTLYESIGLSLGAKLAGAELEGIDLNLLPRLQNDPIAHLHYALALPERIAAADGRRLILYIDEFQDVERIGESLRKGFAAALKRKMRAAFQRSSSVSFLFAGSLEHMMRTIFGSPEEPFYNFGSFHQLEAITADQWRDGLTARFDLDGTRVDPDALEAIINHGAGHPRATMLLAQRAHIASLIAGTRHVVSGLVDAGYRDALLAERPKHEAWVDRIQHLGKPAVNRVALRAITAIARGAAPYNQARYPSGASRALTALRDAGFIERGPRAQTWRVIDPLFRDYLTGIDASGPLARGL